MEIPKLSVLTSKVLQHAGKLGYIYAAVGSDAAGWSRLNAIISSVQQLAAGVFHMPNFGHEVQNLMNNEGRDALYAWLAGLGLEMLGKDDWGKALQKGAISYALGSAGIRLLYGATHSAIIGENIENSVQQNFSKAPLASAYEY